MSRERRRPRRSSAASAAYNHDGEAPHRRVALLFRSNDAIRNFVNGADLNRYGASVVVPPDFAIRHKVAADLIRARSQASSTALSSAPGLGASYFDSYRQYSPVMTRASATQADARSHCPAWCCPGLGLYGLGRHPRLPHRRPSSLKLRLKSHHRCRRPSAPLPADHRSRHVRHRILAI